MKTKLNINLIERELWDRHWTRKDFALKMGISRQLLSYYMNHPSLKSIELIADKLKLKVKDLIK